MTERSFFLKVLLPLICVFIAGGVFLGVYFGVKTPKKGITPIAPPDGPVIVAPPSEGEDPEDNVDWDAYCERNFELTPSSDGTYYILSRAKVNDLEELTIPESYKGVVVKVVAGHAFQNHTETKKVITKKTLDEMGSEVFLDCTSLTQVEMEHYPSVMAKQYDDLFDDAFAGCINITSVKIDAGVVGNAFALAQIIDADEEIFSGSLTSLTLGDGVTELGFAAFSYCVGLTSINIPDKVTIIGENAFSSCNGLTSLTIPGGVTSIGNNAFSDCEELVSLIISEGVTHIGESAFMSCNKLTSVSLPSTILSIDSQAFDYDTNIVFNFAKGIDWNALSIAYYKPFGTTAQTHTFEVHVEDEATGEIARAKLKSMYYEDITITIIVDE